MSMDFFEIDFEDQVFSDDDGVFYDEEVIFEYGIFGFMLWELFIVVVWLVLFVVLFFFFVGDVLLWGVGIQWIFLIGFLMVVVFFFVLCCFLFDGICCVGFLGIDQFVFVVFLVVVVVWVGNLWLVIFGMIFGGFWVFLWNGVVMSIVLFVLVVFIVFVLIIFGFKEDFQGCLVIFVYCNVNFVCLVIVWFCLEFEFVFVLVVVLFEDFEVEIILDE